MSTFEEKEYLHESGSKQNKPESKQECQEEQQLLIDITFSPAPTSIANESSGSIGQVCRICRGDSTLEPLKSICNCKGSVGKIHLACLERWLTQSGTEKCELCGYQYQIERTYRQGRMRSFFQWLTSGDGSMEMIIDILWIILMTPAAIFATYALAMHTLGEEKYIDKPWILLPILIMSSITLGAYYAWVLIFVRYHYNRWSYFWKKNVVIRIVERRDSPRNGISITPNGTSRSLEV